MNSKIVVYFTLDSILCSQDLDIASIPVLNAVKGITPKYLKDTNRLNILEGFKTKLINLKGKPYIDLVLLVPFSEDNFDKIVEPSQDLTGLFDRVYFGNNILGEVDTPSPKSNKDINSILDTIREMGLKDLVIENYNDKSSSPSILLYHKDKDELTRVLSTLKENKLCYSSFEEEEYVKVYLNNIYLDIITKDLTLNTNYPNKGTFSMYIGNKKEDLNFIKGTSIGVVPFDIIDDLSASEFDIVTSSISTIKFIELNENNGHRFPLLACEELMAFVNKIMYK